MYSIYWTGESPDLSPTPRQLGVHQDQNVEQLYPVHIREFGSEWELFQGRQSLLDWRPVYVLLYSVGLITTETVQDRENSLSSGRTSLLGIVLLDTDTIHHLDNNLSVHHCYIVGNILIDTHTIHRLDNNFPVHHC